MPEEYTSVFITVEMSGEGTGFKLVEGDLKFPVPVRIYHFHHHAMRLLHALMEGLPRPLHLEQFTTVTVSLDIQHQSCPLMLSVSTGAFPAPVCLYDFVQQAKESMSELFEKLTDWALEADAVRVTSDKLVADTDWKKKRLRAAYLLKKREIKSACVLIAKEITAHDINHTGRTVRINWKGIMMSEYATPTDWIGRSPPSTKSYYRSPSRLWEQITD